LDSAGYHGAVVVTMTQGDGLVGVVDEVVESRAHFGHTLQTLGTAINSFSQVELNKELLPEN